MTESLLREVAGLLRAESGISLKVSQEAALRSALRRVQPGLDPLGFLRLAADPLGGPEIVQRLIDEVTVKETSFLRDNRQLETISWRLLLEGARAAGRHTIRAWSAGCATGEEVYSLALLAAEAFNAPSPPVDILGTDISGAALAAALEGRYRARSVGPLPAAVRQRYFSDENGLLSVGDALRELVRFQRHNLVRDPVPPLGEEPFDLVLCRNVLIYFDGDTVEGVIDSLERALAPAGTLILGAADALCGTAQRLTRAPDETPLDRRSVPRLARPLRRPLGRVEVESLPELLADARAAAGEGRHADALAKAGEVLRGEPLNADAYFLRGLVLLESGDPAAALVALRRALYVDPAFGLAAFTAGRAHDALGDAPAALRAYEQALRTLEPDDDQHEELLGQVDLGDVAAACRARISALR